MKKIFSLLGLLFLMNGANANWTNAVAISGMVVPNAEGFFLNTAGSGNPLQCGMGDFVFIPASHPNYKQYYATALAALISKQKLSFYVSGCTTSQWRGSQTAMFVGTDGIVVIAP